ncbi:MAG: hypothetical protein ACKO3V_16310, partial [Pirellula sp.]
LNVPNRRQLEKPWASEPNFAYRTSESRRAQIQWNPPRAHSLTVQTAKPSKFIEERRLGAFSRYKPKTVGTMRDLQD